MKDVLKYGSYIIIAGLIAYVCITFKDCGGSGETSGLVVVPRDSAYLPITEKEYRPPSTPFEDPVKPVSKLPKGVKEKDVSKVITIRDLKTKDTTTVIILKSGEVFVPKEDDSLEVTVTNYLSPIFEFGLYPGIGITFSPPLEETKRGLELSPSLSAGFLRVYKNCLISIVVDLRSIGAGVGYQLYHDIALTPTLMWNYNDLQKSIKLNLSVQL